MELAKLTKRLQREAKKSPGKAATLGVITVIAIWFWLPLLSNWFSSSSPTTTAAVAAGPAATPKPEVTAANKLTQKLSEPEFSWTQIAQWLKTDPLMTPADGDSLPNPFQIAVQEKEDVESSEVEEDTSPIDLTPEGLGMQLKSTIVGPRGGVASIDGQAYSVGDAVMKEAGNEAIVFQLVQIDTRRVVLTRDGQQYELKLPRSDLAAALDAWGP